MLVTVTSTRKISKMKQHLGKYRVLYLVVTFWQLSQGYIIFRKEMEVTWNNRGEQYRAEATVMEDKLRNTEQAMMKVRINFHFIVFQCT